MSNSVKGKQQVAVKADVPPPDEEEQLLAKVVFGDTSDFQSELKDFDLELLLNEQEDEIADGYDGDEASGSDNDGDEENENMEHVQDDQLFFVDEGVEQEDQDVDMDEEASSEYTEDSEDESDDAWHDSDDEAVSVSILASNKTKKLRSSYEESSIRGKEYIRRLRAQFEKIYPKPKWVDDVSDEDLSDNQSEDEGSDQAINGDVSALSKILESTYEYRDISYSKLLPPKNLDIVRLKDANATHPSRSAVQSLSFHPHKPLLLTGGYDRTLRIYHIDGKSNHLVTSVHLKGTPVQTCCFYVSPVEGPHKNTAEQRIFSGGRRRYMHSWDLSNALVHSSSHGAVAKIDKISRMYGHEETQRSFEKFKLAHFHNFKSNQSHGIILLQGNNGWINVLNATTGVWMTGCKINGVLADFCIDYKPVATNKAQTILIAANTYSEVWEFNLNDDGKVIRKWKDEGGIGVTKIQVGGGTNSDNILTTESGNMRPNRWLAIGSESGYVNVYDRKKMTDSPKAVASLDQITTTISTLTFSPDGQILCMASRAIKDSLRLVHLPTCTVFSNWPTSGTPLGKVTAAAFSSRGEMLAVGNEQGKVRLWALNHY